MPWPQPWPVRTTVLGAVLEVDAGGGGVVVVVDAVVDAVVVVGAVVAAGAVVVVVVPITGAFVPLARRDDEAPASARSENTIRRAARRTTGSHGSNAP
jgi:hypothetical protein